MPGSSDGTPNAAHIFGVISFDNSILHLMQYSKVKSI